MQDTAIEKEYWWRDCTTVMGVDIGKKGNPSHISVFAIDSEKTSETEDKEVLVQIHQKFLDNWDYHRQVEYLNSCAEWFNVQRGYLDNTRQEMDDRNLSKRIIPISLGLRDGPVARGKMKLATQLSLLVEQRRIKLIDEDRFISQILCVIPKTKVFTRYKDTIKRKGYKNIEDIQIGDKVKTHMNRFRKVINTYKRFIDEDIIELKLDNGEKISLTKNHPVLTVNGWKEAGKLTIDDVLIKIINSHSKINRPNKGQSYTEYYGTERANKIKNKLKLSHLHEHLKEKVVWTCPICGKHLLLLPCRAKMRKFCSKKCEGTFYKDIVKNRENFGASSLKGIDNPNFNPNKVYRPYGLEFTEALKKKIRNRDKYTCQLCGKRGFAVHHVDYNKLNNDENNLITLCHSCHSKTTYTKKLEYYKNLLEAKILLSSGLAHNGLRILKIKNKHYSGPVYNLEVYEDHSYVGRGIVFHNCVTNDLQAPNTPSGHGDSFISVMLAVGVYFDFYAVDRKLGTSFIGNMQDIIDLDQKSKPDMVTLKPEIRDKLCKVCGGARFEILPDGRKKCEKCGTIW